MRIQILSFTLIFFAIFMQSCIKATPVPGQSCDSCVPTCNPAGQGKNCRRDILKSVGHNTFI
ncbi:uncharacterized protein FA14DRAFT_162335 [Meira miltonrushii]|uniref:Uncharacterized protein n=1 Tax=Meira miltonrushii TaxID=1280837 RepID=A0A316V488_9BASI|nr:uncharacterized protein FA14DRAFT_162335 [Meira miltonrushii]PWN32064.1 hypothetical protein FA14DRAFT_162335 [Meira miltonrushii]